MGTMCTLVLATILIAAPAGANAPSHVELGSFAIMSEDRETALVQFKIAAEDGDPVAQHALGHMYEYGIGTAKDLTEALKWYARAAEKGSALGETALAGMYKWGIGVRTNQVEANRLYRKAADQGYSIAQYNLGTIQADETSVPTSNVEAYKWFALAASQHAVGAARQQIFDNALAKAASNLTPEQRQAADVVVRNWRPQQASR